MVVKYLLRLRFLVKIVGKLFVKTTIFYSNRSEIVFRTKILIVVKLFVKTTTFS